MFKAISISVSFAILLALVFLYLRPQHRKISASLSILPNDLDLGYRMIAQHQYLSYPHHYDGFSIDFANISIKLVFRFLIFTAFVIVSSFFSNFIVPSIHVIGITTLDFVLQSIWSKDFNEIIASEGTDSPFYIVDLTAKKAFRIPLFYTLINDILLYVSLLNLK